jgi:ubiquinone/menaquinone biosynthesis C-methylase UbiE
MHSFARGLHKKSDKPSGKSTRGLVINLGWRYDLIEWVCDRFLFGGKIGQLRQKALDMAQIQANAQVLDVGCGTGTLAIKAQESLGPRAHISGIDPGTEQIAYARSKAARRKLPIDFQIGVIEQLPFSEQSFDLVLSTIMFHHLSDSLKRQGLSEIARVLKTGGYLVIADFKRPKGHQKQAMQFGSVRDLPALIEVAGFSIVATDEMPFPAASTEVTFVKARKNEAE